MTPTDDSRWIAPMPLGELSAPRVLLVADAADRAAGMAAIVSVGATPAGPAALAEGAAMIDRRNHEAVLVELGEGSDGDGDMIDVLLDALDRATARGARGVVTLPATMIDAVTARITSPAIALLCAPQPSERTMELALALAAPSRLLHDVGAEGAVRLRQLSEEVGRIARTLASLSVERAPLPGEAPLAPDEDMAPPPAIDAATIRAIIRARRLRAHYFDSALFADPAWDMLLDLAAARLEGTPVAVSSLCIAAAVPPTTALRWLKSLTDAGLFVRVADPRDRRRVFIELDRTVAARMTAYLAAAARISPLPV